MADRRQAELVERRIELAVKPRVDLGELLDEGRDHRPGPKMGLCRPPGGTL